MLRRGKAAWIDAAAVVFLVCAASGCHADDDTRSIPDPRPCPPRRPPVETSVQEIVAGKFPTAIDKRATCGTYVKVRHLKVLRVVAEDDGDWHVEVTDGKTPVFITELIPADQKREGKPRVGVYIDETGTAYNDLAADGARHQYTTWEIHPITAWTRSKRQ